MPLPSKLRIQYLARFDELIQRGQAIHDSITVKPGELDYSRKALLDQYLNEIGTPKSPPRGPSYEVVDHNALTTWEINYTSLLDQVIPQSSIQRKLLEPYASLEYKSGLSKKISALRAIKEDFEQGFLDDIALQIEAEIASDYMGQAEELLSEGQFGKFDHVPAAVLSGAILEKTLRSLCGKQTPPVATTRATNKGKREPLTLNSLIDELKKAAVFNELKAKQLRAWADIRNAAAHGEFEKFTRSDVEQMLQGVSDFLATYMA